MKLKKPSVKPDSAAPRVDISFWEMMAKRVMTDNFDEIEAAVERRTLAEENSGASCAKAGGRYDHTLQMWCWPRNQEWRNPLTASLGWKK